ncbi:hypothetical protein DHW03_01355 [Pedobacter yonginense]|uniref:Uncharacterized protein n=1 Tax=Pedobacter yonginense TaxID=651869 RepID=A0A317EPX7_9SPHI|nr:hypothetical protein [Pedobacter yonginense]PWS28532.1 hypothetical protein DHW03_01355 [Pedobacter yonginense]
METQNDYPLYITSFAKKLSLYSFIIGIVLTLLFLLTKEGFLIGVGLLYSGLAFVSNTLVLLMLLLSLVLHRDQRQEILLTILISLANIPAFCACFYLITLSQF